MSENEYTAWLRAQRETTVKAKALATQSDFTINTHGSSPYKVITHHAGAQVKPGALRLPITITQHENVPMTLKDGTTLYCDVFVPDELRDLSVKPQKQMPAIVAWTPYGKQNSKPNIDEFPFRAGISVGDLSGLETFEGPDPAFWCSYGYVVVNVEARGSRSSEGDLFVFGHQEAEDGAEFVTWLSDQAGCNGKIALTGNSWLSIAQWRIGSLRPRGLAALAPWEGFHDAYRHHFAQGGVPFTGFHDDIKKQLQGRNKQEDPALYIRQSDLWDTYWDDKRAHPEWIDVPTYVVGSWTNQVHTPGTFKSWSLIPESTPKWLRVHNKMEWPDYYDNNSTRDLLRFFDFYLRDMVDNGWDATPKVRLSVLNLGLTTRSDTVNRAEAEFPLARTRYTKHFLQQDSALGESPPPEVGVVTYDSASGVAIFEFTMPRRCETTGYFMAHLVVSTLDHDEMDVFVRVQQLSKERVLKGTTPIQPTSVLTRSILKLCHDYGVGMRHVGAAFHWGPEGQMRGGFALTRNQEMGRVGEPYYNYDKKTPFVKGEERVLDIALRPYGMYWEAGDILRLSVSGRSLESFPIPNLEVHLTNNVGTHQIHTGGRGQESSYLLLPYV